MKLKPTRENAFEMERLRKSYSLLRGKGKLLDVGCGDGPFHQFIKNYTITGLDPNPTAIARANKQHKKHTYLQAGIEYLPNIPSSSYDAICCFEVLEHLPTKVVDEVMQQFHRILKPDGELIISVPQQYYPELLFGYLIGPKSPLGYSKTHFRNYSRHKLTSLVKKHGFVNPIVRGYHVFIPFLAKILGEAPAINFKSNLSWKWPSASQTIIVRSTKLSRR